MSGLDIEKAKEATACEDVPSFAHLHGVDGQPLFYDVNEHEVKPVGIYVTGVQSKQHRIIEAQQRKRRLSKKDMTAERAIKDHLARVVNCTTGWEGIHVNGVPVEPTKENIRTLYVELEWVYDQVVDHMNEHSNFFKNGSSE